MDTGEVSEEEAETYTLVSTALKHPIRRRILRMLGEGALTFTEMQEPLKINSAHLSYHLNAMRELLSQTESGEYFLSTFGEATLSLMHRVEETEGIRPDKKGKRMNLWFIFLVSLLILAGIPTAIHFILEPPDFPVGSFTVEPLTLSDHTVTFENDSFAFSLDYWTVDDQGQVEMSEKQIWFATKVEITTKWLKLDLNHVVDRSTRYYWLSNDEGGFPIGEYASSFLYRESETHKHKETEVVCGWRSISEDWESHVTPHITELQFMGRPYLWNTTGELLISMINEEGRGIPLPKSFLNEYSFKLVVYTNATIGPDEVPARFVLIYKNAMFIGSLRIDPPTIGYGMILLPFALLIIRFWKPFKGLQRPTHK